MLVTPSYDVNKIEPFQSVYVLFITASSLISSLISSRSYLQMASTSNSLYIGYARASCTTEDVKHTFESILGPDIVDHVDESIKKDTKGYDFKMFFIHFKASTAQLEHTYKRIDKETFVSFVYNTEWDRRKWCDRTQQYGAYVQRYWKVTHYIKKEKPQVTITPHIMTAEEAALLTPPKHTITNPPKISVKPDAPPKNLENMFAALELEEGEVVE